MRNYVLKDDEDVRVFEHPSRRVVEKVQELLGFEIIKSDVIPDVNPEFFVYEASVEQAAHIAKLPTYEEKVEFCNKLILDSSFIRPI